MKAVELIKILQEKVKQCELSEEAVVYFRDDRGFIHDLNYEIKVDEEGDAALTDGLSG